MGIGGIVENCYTENIKKELWKKYYIERKLQLHPFKVEKQLKKWFSQLLCVALNSLLIKGGLIICQWITTCLLKVLHPTCLYMQKILQIASAVNNYAHEYPTISKYHMLPIHLRGEISTKKICFFTIGLYGNLQISHMKTTKHARIFEILAVL